MRQTIDLGGPGSGPRPKNGGAGAGSGLSDETQANIRELQKENGLPVTGVLDSKTQAFINSGGAPAKAAAIAKQVAAQKAAAQKAAAAKLAAQKKQAAQAKQPIVVKKLSHQGTKDIEMAGKPLFGGKKAAPFVKGGGRSKTHPRDAHGNLRAGAKAFIRKSQGKSAGGNSDTRKLPPKQSAMQLKKESVNFSRPTRRTIDLDWAAWDAGHRKAGAREGDVVDKKGKKIGSVHENLTTGKHIAKHMDKHGNVTKETEHDSEEAARAAVHASHGDKALAAMGSNDVELAYVGFNALKAKLSGHVDNPGAVAAAIGRKKYGRKGFAKLSGAGHSKGAKHSFGANKARAAHIKKG